MKCKDIQDKLLLSGIGDDMKEHLSQCSECAEFSKIVSGMNEMQAPGPSAALDAKILSYARENRPSKKAPIPFFVLTAVAALLIIGFSVMLMAGKADDSNDGSDIAKKPVKENSIDDPKPKQMIADNKAAAEDLEDALDTLWDDEIMSADIAAIEGELFVLSAELYDN